MAKAIESIIYIVIFSEVKNCILPNQHCFYPGRCVETNLIIFAECLLSYMDTLIQNDTIYIECSKARHRIDHNILINTLS